MMTVGITGRKRSGKSTLATELVARSPRRAQIVAFADPLRDMLYRLDPDIRWSPASNITARLSKVIDGWGWEGVKDTGYGRDVRRLLQRLGTEAVRHEDPDFWVQALLRRIDATPSGTLVVIPDVRFYNETEVCDYILRVDRPSLSHDDDPHESEAFESLPYNVILINDGTPADLGSQALRALAPYIT